jgi:hypothetical protein
MVVRPAAELPALYEADETAWLEAMSRLAADRRAAELDLDNLSEYLASMAKRDKREVVSRLVVLLTHLLKWDYQPDKRSPSWAATINAQRDQLADLFESGTLRRHAEAVLATAFARAASQAAVETELDPSPFPATCPYSWEQILGPSG